MTDLIIYERAELVSGAEAAQRARAIDLAVAAWLDAKRGRSGSIHTARAYETTITSFRAQLQAQRLDLDSPAELVALVAQAWAAQRASGAGFVAPASHNRRLAVLSSFYEFAHKRRLLDIENPIGQVDRRSVQEYAGSKALAPSDVRAQLARIDRNSLAGLRDYALLSVALSTGRRVAELAAMRWAHVHIEASGARITITFPHAKGGKVMRDTLGDRVARALLEYLYEYYGPELGQLAPEAPIWPRLDRGVQDAPEQRACRAVAMSARALQDIGHKRLGVHFHALRHTFAHTMLDTGANVSTIQKRLGHSSLQTTSRYLESLRADENPHANQLGDLFAI